MTDPNKAAVTESNAEFLERMKRPEDNDRPGDFERLIALAEERNIETLNATIADMEVRHAAVMLHAQTHADEYNELQSSFEDEVTKRERAEQLLLEAEDRSIQHLGAAIQEKAKRERAEAERDAALKDAERLDKANTELAQESCILRLVLGELVDAVNGTNDLDEMDGEEYQIASKRLDDAMAKAIPHTEEAIQRSFIDAAVAARKEER